MNQRRGRFSALLGCAALLLSLSDSALIQAAEKGTTKVAYTRDILPILSANCFNCHGPDGKARKSGLRLDEFVGATKELKTGAIGIVPKDPKASEAMVRILSQKDDRMPPKEFGKTLTPREIDLLKRWIEEGAEYQKHWAFTAPIRPIVPKVNDSKWVRNPIDAFVLNRLTELKFAPTSEADRYALARRAAIDLTGLPPSLDLVDKFVKDPSSDAFEKYVDQLLASKTYGERWAAVWLDLARYADSNGFADDRLRTIWSYRDWVIEAINDNLPFDQFTIEQLAGDLLPNPTQKQILATGFHRNTLTNDEGGTSDEEFRVAAVVDRVNTTTQVWMGLTMACAQCHNHKYDPLTQEEYYKLFAILNQTTDNDQGDNSPLITLATKEQLEQKAHLEKEAADLDKQLHRTDPALDAAQEKWEKETAKDKLPKNIQTVLAIEVAKRGLAQKEEVKKYFRSIAPEVKESRDKLAGSRKQLADLNAKIPTSPIMKELPKDQQRKTNILVRGNFLEKDREVSPGFPAIIPPLPEKTEPNRLALANWLMTPSNPLTARVAVNRYWEQLFGRGLVDTPEDWGLRSKPPLQPELLDWLATEFIAQKWDVKKLLKMMVTSATYRQGSKVTPELLERDPENQYFARGPRFRSSAEVIRDQSLFVSGLLSPKMYGAPVRPIRPRLGLASAFGGSTDWDTSPGEDRHRRALYTEWRRTTPYPSMTTFDATSRNVCTVSRPRTNTPLQALVTLNDPVYVEAAQALARRIVKEGGDSLESRLKYAFRVALTRPPSEAELTRLTDLFKKTQEKFAKTPKEAESLASDPLGPIPKEMNAIDLAAWTVVSNVLLNLDEMFAKR